MGCVTQARREVRDPQRGARKHHLQRQCRDRARRGPAAAAGFAYYEGANQFDLRTLVPDVSNSAGLAVAAGDRCPAQSAVSGPAGASTGWLATLEGELALARRVQALLAAGNPAEGGGEWAKTDYALVWPRGVDERNPDIARSDLPVHLSTILHDLDAIRAAGNAAGAELVLASFIWLVKDGMVLHPIRHRSILEYLNQSYAPFRYRDLERLAAFESRVFAKYARVRRPRLHRRGASDAVRSRPLYRRDSQQQRRRAPSRVGVPSGTGADRGAPSEVAHGRGRSTQRKSRRRPSSRGPSPSPAPANPDVAHPGRRGDAGAAHPGRAGTPHTLSTIERPTPPSTSVPRSLDIGFMNGLHPRRNQFIGRFAL